MKPIRQRILETLKTRKAATPKELSRALQVTPADVRHHIRKLIEEGLIVASGERPPQGRGRPSKIYQLARREDNLGLLATALLDELWAGLSAGEQAARTQAVAARLAGEPGDAPRHITQRLYQAVQRLNELNYDARWEAHADAPRVVLGHCPYVAIVDDTPALCQVDAFLLETLLGERVEQTAKRVQNRQGVRVCLFAVGKG